MINSVLVVKDIKNATQQAFLMFSQYDVLDSQQTRSLSSTYVS